MARRRHPHQDKKGASAPQLLRDDSSVGNSPTETEDLGTLFSNTSPLFVPTPTPSTLPLTNPSQQDGYLPTAPSGKIQPAVDHDDFAGNVATGH